MLRKASMTAAAVISLVMVGATPLQAAAGGPNRRQWRDRVEDVRDRREDIRDRREDFRDWREDIRDRREDLRDWRR
jgi:hypothetical protein